ncbi:hypothetical protein LEP1GSC035_1526 [Leptospira noguchii str. 2007001578]|uniref:Uncharacterized protein n=1 Tax=Leptospira noguchii str. 2007001578 TaxID=1049974 RepID=A0ABN0IZ48_9LEPT|nr:hypothetical protein LEP1GSC035_1526 [Leptospira noguchii str. 2007001578]
MYNFYFIFQMDLNAGSARNITFLEYYNRSFRFVSLRQLVL